MQFTAATPSTYQSMQDPNQGDSNVEVAQQIKPGAPLGFTLKGTGVINESPQTPLGRGAATGSATQGRDSRPLKTARRRPPAFPSTPRSSAAISLGTFWAHSPCC